ncbi:unnamed protein product [Dovyalis caffra]|uniref:Uncharacterized protein n=1 Tax=Dovyalis caffra TaxID=77055 RepID=A0AAV1SEJ5_9ROSI|nr:unnamed protein product [Dovyalis caffra]
MASSSSQERSKQLHNFSLPCLKWGNQRLLRCVKVSDDINDHQDHQHQQQGFQSKPINLVSYKNHKPNPIQVNNFAEKRLKLPSSSPSFVVEEEKGGNIDESPRPWNLRTRRAACKAPLRIEEQTTRRNVAVSPSRYLEIDSPKKYYESLMIRRQQSFEMKEKVKFSVPLSKREIEEDFLEMVRIRPPRRPKKRPRIVQKYLDSIFPGLWLAEITPDSYKVHESSAQNIPHAQMQKALIGHIIFHSRLSDKKPLYIETRVEEANMKPPGESFQNQIWAPEVVRLCGNQTLRLNHNALHGIS